MTEYVTGQIYGWNGGECPVHPKTKVEAWFRSGVWANNKCDAGICSWDHTDDGSDIVCFKVITPYVEPKVIWVVRDIRNGGSDILYVGDQESIARRAAGIDPENRLVEKYVQVKE